MDLKSPEEKEIKDGNKEYWEAKQNLLGFFGLLLKIDMRNNPQNYEKQNNENNRDTNNTD